mmetsp:Transcript_66345/g.215855  ORF Transcript_66345/g.215855 Transcript_66345/m.215855 type:complete len:289 (-) Transcript_66345:22-888(-)
MYCSLHATRHGIDGLQHGDDFLVHALRAGQYLVLHAHVDHRSPLEIRADEALVAAQGELAGGQHFLVGLAPNQGLLELLRSLLHIPVVLAQQPLAKGLGAVLLREVAEMSQRSAGIEQCHHLADSCGNFRVGQCPRETNGCATCLLALVVELCCAVLLRPSRPQDDPGDPQGKRPTGNGLLWGGRLQSCRRRGCRHAGCCRGAGRGRGLVQGLVARINLFELPRCRPSRSMTQHLLRQRQRRGRGGAAPPVAGHTGTTPGDFREQGHRRFLPLGSHEAVNRQVLSQNG